MNKNQIGIEMSFIEECFIKISITLWNFGAKQKLITRQSSVLLNHTFFNFMIRAILGTLDFLCNQEYR